MIVLYIDVFESDCKTLMNVVKELTDVNRTVIIPLVLMCVAATVVIVLEKMEYLAMVMISRFRLNAYSNDYYHFRY